MKQLAIALISSVSLISLVACVQTTGTVPPVEATKVKVAKKPAVIKKRVPVVRASSEGRPGRGKSGGQFVGKRSKR